jgi:hypothetical protein
MAARSTVDNFSRVLKYLDRMPPEFSVLAVSMATRKKPELSSATGFSGWAARNQQVLF